MSSREGVADMILLFLSLAAGRTPCPSVRFEEGSLLRQRHARLHFENRAGKTLESAHNANMPIGHQQKEAAFLREKDAAMRARTHWPAVPGTTDFWRQAEPRKDP